MPTVIALPPRPPARPPARPLARPPSAPASPAGGCAAHVGWVELLAAACSGLLPAEARLEDLLDRIEALP